jgi:hypothetical protein
VTLTVFATFINVEIEKWLKVVAASNVKQDRPAGRLHYLLTMAPEEYQAKAKARIA